jgi:hypothetical protein
MMAKLNDEPAVHHTLSCSKLGKGTFLSRGAKIAQFMMVNGWMFGGRSRKQAQVKTSLPVKSGDLDFSFLIEDLEEITFGFDKIRSRSGTPTPRKSASPSPIRQIPEFGG